MTPKGIERVKKMDGCKKSLTISLFLEHNSGSYLVGTNDLEKSEETAQN